MTVLVTDVHGCLSLLGRVLVAFPDRPFLFMGDMIDRGPDSPGVVARVRELHAEGRATVLRGNHEDMMIRGVKYGSEPYLNCWLSNGGAETAGQYHALGGARFAEDLDWLEANSLHWHALDTPEGRMLVSHASRPQSRLMELYEPGDPYMSFTHEAHLWTGQQKSRTPLARGYAVSAHGHIPQLHPKPKPRRENGAYFLDIGACKTGLLAALDAETMQLHTFSD